MSQQSFDEVINAALSRNDKVCFGEVIECILQSVSICMQSSQSFNAIKEKMEKEYNGMINTTLNTIVVNLHNLIGFGEKELIELAQKLDSKSIGIIKYKEKNYYDA